MWVAESDPVLTPRSSRPAIASADIENISLHNPIPIQARLYGLPFLSEL
jgi:hypothetical protein